MPTDFPLKSLEVYLSRASLSGVDFEQYKISGETLFFECGILKRGHHQVKGELVEKLKARQRQELASKTWGLSQSLTGLKEPFEKPGQSRNMFDPGRISVLAELPNRKIEIESSLDSIASPQNRAQTATLRLVGFVRGLVSNEPCGLRDFYDIPKYGTHSPTAE